MIKKIGENGKKDGGKPGGFWGGQLALIKAELIAYPASPLSPSATAWRPMGKRGDPIGIL